VATAEETKSALIDALLRLLTSRGIGAVSVRDVAAMARVNHGLVHRYFGSKEGLLREATRRVSTRLLESSRTEKGLGARWYELLRREPELAVIVARCCLDGPHDLLSEMAPPPAELAEIVRPLREALERMGLGGEVDPYLVNAFFTSALLGWFVFRPLFEAGYRLPRRADDRLAKLLQLLDAAVGAGSNRS
jgi:AcrR family transcriptional regulator